MFIFLQNQEVKMKVKITRWGNSLGIRLPVFVAQSLGLSAGDRVEVTLENRHILITPLKPALRDLVKSIPPDVQGGETDWGDDVGEEIIR